MSDHKPLEMIVKKPISGAPARLQRMLLKIASYNIVVQYKPGKQMLLSDALSRLRIHKQSSQPAVELDVRVSLLRFSPTRLDELRQHTQSDEETRILSHTILKGWPSRRCEADSRIRQYWSVRDSLVIDDGIILKGDAAVVPHALRRWYIDRLHDGHQGLVKMNLRARDSVFWPDIRRDIDARVRECLPCQSTRPSVHRSAMQEEHQHPVPGGPWIELSSDLFHHDGHNYILIVDHYSKYPFVFRLAEGTTSHHVVNVLARLFAEHGSPSTLYTDNGPQYASREFAEFAKDFEFRHCTSSPHHHRSNGIAERHVRVVKDLMMRSKTRVAFYKGLRALRATPIDERLPSPAQLLFGRSIDCLPRRYNGDPHVAECLQRRQELQRNNHNARFQKPQPPTTFSVGERVLTKNPQSGRWDPAEIIERHSAPASYTVAPAPPVSTPPNPYVRDVAAEAQETPAEQHGSQISTRQSGTAVLRRTAEHIRSPYRTHSGRAVRPPARFRDEGDVTYCS